MSTISLVTPTYRRDLELCTLLCESVDRYVTSFSKHYLIVADEELPLFAKFNSDRRAVLPTSLFLPAWLRPLPRFVRRGRRQYWWSLRSWPVSGWHVQQFIKIAAASVLPEERHSVVDLTCVLPALRSLSLCEPQSDAFVLCPARGRRRRAAARAMGPLGASAAGARGAGVPGG